MCCLCCAVRVMPGNTRQATTWSNRKHCGRQQQLITTANCAEQIAHTSTDPTYIILPLHLPSLGVATCSCNSKNRDTGAVLTKCVLIKLYRVCAGHLQILCGLLYSNPNQLGTVLQGVRTCGPACVAQLQDPCLPCLMARMLQSAITAGRQEIQ